MKLMRSRARAGSEGALASNMSCLTAFRHAQFFWVGRSRSHERDLLDPNLDLRLDVGPARGAAHGFRTHSRRQRPIWKLGVDCQRRIALVSLLGNSTLRPATRLDRAACCR